MKHANEHPAGWTPERCRELRKLWRTRYLSARRIAELLGGGVTRNAVIGKARRMNLQARA